MQGCDLSLSLSLPLSLSSSLSWCFCLYVQERRTDDHDLYAQVRPPDLLVYDKEWAEKWEIIQYRSVTNYFLLEIDRWTRAWQSSQLYELGFSSYFGIWLRIP